MFLASHMHSKWLLAFYVLALCFVCNLGRKYSVLLNFFACGLVLVSSGNMRKHLIIYERLKSLAEAKVIEGDFRQKTYCQVMLYAVVLSCICLQHLIMFIY